MLKTLKNKIVLIIAAVTVSIPMLIPLQASAGAPVPSNQGGTGGGGTINCNTLDNSVNSGINATTGGSTGCGAQGSITNGIDHLAVKVVDIFSVVVGIVSVIMIIYAGFRYVTSGGESASVSGAKNTLVYAIIGLVIVVLAQLIVHYVLNTATSVASYTTGSV